ncbi:Diadenylate cyclase [Lentibacillus sp. JNUCC-1]|uniref:CdaR family protein n=1 Tax=Lentibacillus sp. JNUCC-1 TaxID=2654513 RepID=UPI0012E96D72|nr:CdaR family protein [Lentibacillus sp. JNUCC-1]MUV38203.1 Diadenylate cyclase [Lentibacillus sp. JNUCC-1]
MDKWFKSKWFVRALSLAFAISLYIFVSVEENPAQEDLRFFGSSTETETLTDVPVDIKVDDDNYVVSGVPETINATLEGSKSALTKAVRQRNFTVFVDLRGLGEGEHTVDIEYENVPSDLTIYIEPKTIDVTVEERASQEFSVSVDYLNEDKLPDGYELGDVSVDPGTVTVTSSKTVIEQIAIVKVFIDVGGIDQAITNREVPVNVYDSQGNELRVNVEPENVKVSVDVDNPSKTVPLSVETTGDLPEGLEMDNLSTDTNEVTIYAKKAILADIDTIKTEPIDLSKVEESGTMEVKMDLPDGVKVSGGSKVNVKVDLNETKLIEDISIDTENLPSDQSLTIIEPETGTAAVQVSGTQQSLADLTKSDFEIVVDADGLEEGEHVLPVSIRGPENVTYTSELTEVTVEISESEA